MKLKVTNLGVLGSAEIDLSKRINLFFGENGTGKTYLAYLIYSVTSNTDVISFVPEFLKVIGRGSKFSIELSEETFGLTSNLLAKNIHARMFDVFALPLEKAQSIFKETVIEFSELTPVPEFMQEDITSKWFSGRDYRYRRLAESNFNYLTFEVEPLSESEPPISIQSFAETLLNRILFRLLIRPVRSSSIFPVERNSVYTFSRELSIRRNELLDEIQLLNSSTSTGNGLTHLSINATRYPLAIRDTLRVAEDLENISKGRSFLYDLAVEMETELLGGVVSTTTEGQVEFASQRAPKLNLSFHQSSSIVKTLASLIIYMKHRATLEDLVIIDEPELNLHPKAQIILTRYLARMAKAGLRLLISTHSDYIVREFNNLIMLHGQKDDQELRKLGLKNGYAEADVDGVDPEMVGAHHFSFATPKAKKALAKEIKLDEFGFEVSSFDETITHLNKVSDELYYAKKYGKVVS